MIIKNRGQTTVEFALSVLVLLTFVFALIDFAIMLYVNLTMQHAVREGMRQAVTTSSGTDDAHKQLLIDTIKDYSNGLYEKNSNDQKDPIVRVITPSTSFDNYSGHTTSGTGKADDIVMVSLTYSWHLLTPFLKPFFPNGTYTFTVRTTMKNERGA